MNGAVGPRWDEFVAAVDRATSCSALGYGVNCGHPDEVAAGLDTAAPETSRLLGCRLNAARQGEAGAGDPPKSFASACVRVAKLAPSATAWGGCCGTDTPHISALLEAWGDAA
ncbi:homocysteine S-methyltransferase family protein [Leucobacter albus]|uniref:Homocysteine S-methyltransferase family protein n=1 Tax=Leucobacter albus TaxID=272210 RepID=A0ABW3TU64_9MICO